MSNESEIVVRQMNGNLFKTLVMFTRKPLITDIAEELEYYSNDNVTIIGTILLDYSDRYYNVVILCRDDVGKFRAFDTNTDFENLEAAREWLIGRIRWHTSNGIKRIPLGIEKPSADIFQIIVNNGKVHPYFLRLRDDAHYYAAKQVIIEIMKFFKDIDGNFVEQFQSLNGFDARLWEIYLFCLLNEENFDIIREHDSPDFIISKYGTEIALEAVIVDRKEDNPPKYFTQLKEKLPEEIEKEISNDMPLRFGSPLFSKLKKKYWELPHVKNKPIILAVADFHDDQSMTWSYNALIDYLYGLKFSALYDDKENLRIISKKILPYTKKSGAKIEAGYFFQPDVENISAVLFSSTATLSKFTRMGIQSGFRFQKQKVFRYGVKYKHDPNASKPDMFGYEVNEECNEDWSEGVNLFHNPNALIKIDKSLFPSVAHHELKNGLIYSTTPDFHPYFSFNYNIIVKDDMGK